MKNPLQINKIFLQIFALLIFITSFNFAQNRNWEDYPEEIKQTKQFKRYENFYRPRSLENGVVPTNIYKEEYLKERIKEDAMTEKVLGGAAWQNVGPTGIISSFPSQWGVSTGRVRAIAVHPTDPNTLYVGVSAGGLWKSTNAGSTWQDIGNTFESLTFGAVAIDPSNPNTIYAGSGESMYNFNMTIFGGKGLFKSTNAGVTWSNVTSGFGDYTHFSALKVDPNNSSIIYAALASGYWLNSTPGNEGIWRSTDAGITWSREINGNDGFEVIPDGNTAGRVYATAGSNFYISTDYGANWSTSNTGLIGTRNRMAVRQSGTSLYLLSYGGGAMTLYKSTNNGASWTNTNNWSSGQGWYDLLLGVNPSDDTEVYVGDAELRRSTNSGSAFSYVGGGYWSQAMHVDFHYMTFAPSNNDIRYVGSDGGIYKSTNGGSDWNDINTGLRTLQFYRIASHPTDPNKIWGGAQDNGNFATTDAGATNWTLVTTGDGMECFVDYNNGNRVFMATQNGSLYRATNGGTTYGSFSGISPSHSQPVAWTAPFFQHPTSPDVLFTASNRPWKSTNAGSSWSATTASAVTSSSIHTMDISKADPNTMILASSQYDTTPDVHVSSDGGTTWTNVTSNIGGANAVMGRVVCDPVDGNTVYVVRSGFSSGNKIYKSTDLGSTWSNITGDLPNVPHSDLFIDPENPTYLFTANDFGIYVSSNGGTNWVRVANGLPYVVCLDFDYVDYGTQRLLRVGTHGRSAYQIDLDGVVPVELTSFTATVSGNSVSLNWVTATETNNSGFEIERKSIEGIYERIGFVNGNGTTTEESQYSYTDDNLPSGEIGYRLKQVDFDGSFSYSDVTTVSLEQPNTFTLDQNYPNPFNPSTKINFSISENADVKIKVFDINGREVTTIINNNYTPGTYSVNFNASKFASGTYLYKLTAKTQSGNTIEKSQKMILLK